MEYFQRAVAIRKQSGDQATSLIATSYLCMSRVYFLKKEYQTAIKMVADSESLFIRTIGPNSPFLAQ